MEKTIRQIILFLVLLAAFGLSGCGGGGGGGGGTPVDTGTINKDNIKAIVGGLNPYASLGGVDDYLADLQITDHDCQDGGNVITTGSISDPPAVNDTMTVTYNDCNEFGVITDGTMTMTITQISDNIDVKPWNVTIHLEYNMSSEDVNSGLVSTSSADNMYLSLSEDEDGNVGVMMQGDLQSLQWDDEIETLSNFNLNFIYNSITGANSTDLNGDLDSTMIGDPISFETITPFTSDGNTDYATTGVLHITTSIDNSQALLTAQADGVSLEIKVDAAGDGDYEYVDLIPWSDL